MENVRSLSATKIMKQRDKFGSRITAKAPPAGSVRAVGKGGIVEVGRQNKLKFKLKERLTGGSE